MFILTGVPRVKGERTMRESLQDYCIRTGALHLLAEWDSAANGTRTPETISYGSKQRVHWRCAAGHTWTAAVYTRTSHHSGCPVCSGRQVQAGANDLATTHPALAAEWHPTKNGTLTPQDVSAGSKRRVWWQCAQGHTWQATVKSRALGGAGCPVCTGRQVEPGVNDLATTHPDIAAQWHPEKNGPLTPRDVSAGSKRQVWWQCSQGHVWQARIASRVTGRGCPVCAGRRIVPGENDLAASHPDLARQWHPSRNGDLSPDRLAPHSNRKVWWQCAHGHAWQATPASRLRGSGCPYCSGRKVLPGFNDLASRYPALAREWKQALNGMLTPQDVTPASHKKVWWQCPAGHLWQARIASRTHGAAGCPVCAGRAGTSHLAMQERRE